MRAAREALRGELWHRHELTSHRDMHPRTSPALTCRLSLPTAQQTDPAEQLQCTEGQGQRRSDPLPTKTLARAGGWLGSSAKGERGWGCFNGGRDERARERALAGKVPGVLLQLDGAEGV